MKYVNCSKCGGTGKQVDQRALGLQLRQMRLKAGLSLQRMAYEMKITPPYLCDLELGNRRWDEKRVEDFKRICEEDSANAR